MRIAVCGTVRIAKHAVNVKAIEAGSAEGGIQLLLHLMSCLASPSQFSDFTIGLQQGSSGKTAGQFQTESLLPSFCLQGIPGMSLQKQARAPASDAACIFVQVMVLACRKMPRPRLQRLPMLRQTSRSCDSE